MEKELYYYVILSITRIGEKFDKLQYKLNDVIPDVVKNSKIGKKKLYTKTESIEEDLGNYVHQFGRKYTSLLNRQQLLDLVEECYFDETCDTMGSLSLEYGLLPAISFTCYEIFDIWSYNAYVSPITDLTVDEIETSNEKLKEHRLNYYNNELDRIMNLLLESNGDLDKLDSLPEKLVLDNWDQLRLDI